LRIAEAYSQRLNPKFQGIKQLVQEYPSHQFVIDFEEAKKLFGAVREPTQEEAMFEEFLRDCGCVPNEARVPVICLLDESLKEDVDDVKTDEHDQTSGDGVTVPNRETSPAAMRVLDPQERNQGSTCGSNEE